MFGNKAEKVAKLAEKGKSEKLVALVHDKDVEIRRAATAGLGQCKDDTAFNALVPLLRDADASIRTAAAKALGDLGRPSARVHLEFQIGAEKDATVLAALKAALVKMHSEQ